MSPKITAQEAIIRGYLLLVVTPLLAFVIFGVSFSAWLEGLKTQEVIDPEVFLYPIPIFIALLLLLVLGIPKGKKYYRKWAIENVTNLEEFRTKALKARFIDTDDVELDERIKQEKKAKPKTTGDPISPSSANPKNNWEYHTPCEENHVYYYSDAGIRGYIIRKSIGLILGILPALIFANVISMFFRIPMEYVLLAFLGIGIFSLISQVLEQKKQFVSLNKYHCKIYYTSNFSKGFLSFSYNLSGVEVIPWYMIDSISLHNDKIKIVANKATKNSLNKTYTSLFGTKGSATNPVEIVEVMNRYLPIRSNTDWKNEV